MGLFTDNEIKECKVPCFIGKYPLKGEIIESTLVATTKAIKSHEGLKTAVYVLSQEALDLGFDAVHNIFIQAGDYGNMAIGDAIKLKK